jgi:nicotinic acid mononucleotide adenylyltransferase
MTTPVTSSLAVAHSAASVESMLEGKQVIVYAPITGNPPHLGHLNVAAEAAKTARKVGAEACKVFLGLASQDYLQQKKASDRLKLTTEQRIQMLNLTIEDAKNLNLFPEDVEVSYCGMEGKDFHVGQYRDIKRGNADWTVVLTAGADLQKRMRNWESQENFIAFIQHRGIYKATGGPNRIVLEESGQFADVSSTGIREAVLKGKDPSGIGLLALGYLKKIVPLPFTFMDLRKQFGSYGNLICGIADRFPNEECDQANLSVQEHPEFKQVTLPVAIFKKSPTLEDLPSVLNLANAITINRSYPDRTDGSQTSKYDKTFQVEGTPYTCFRINHNGTHSYRQLRYLEVLLDLIPKIGRPEAIDCCKTLTEEESVNLKLAVFFLRAGRLDETDSQQQGSDKKLLRSSQLYEHYAKGMGISDKSIAFARQLIVDNCCPSAKLTYKADGQWNPQAFWQSIFTLVHEIDLVRCYPDFETRTAHKLQENLSGWVLDPKHVANAAAIATSLQNYGIEANKFVGQQVNCRGIPYDLERFYIHSTFGSYCNYRLSKLKFDDTLIKALSATKAPGGGAAKKASTKPAESCVLM